MVKQRPNLDFPLLHALLQLRIEEKNAVYIIFSYYKSFSFLNFGPGPGPGPGLGPGPGPGLGPGPGPGLGSGLGPGPGS